MSSEVTEKAPAKSAGPPATAKSTSIGGVSERRLVFLIGAVQFVNILDFMMVMPLGPDFADALGVPVSKLGIIGGSYTAAAAVSGLVGSLFLDRFDRRSGLVVAMLGLVVGTLLGGFATGFATLVGARILAGIFGGPATSLSMSVIADVIPPERRGRAMSAVMGAFAIASVLGVPIGLELARLGSWRTPFFVVGALGLVITLLARTSLPSLRMHLEGAPPRQPGRELVEIRGLFTNPLIIASYVMTAVTMMSGFILIPNLSAYTQYNLGYPRARLGLLYLCGGVVSFFSMRIVGILVDRHGSTRLLAVGTALLITIMYIGFYMPVPPIPVLPLFVGFMLAMAFRNVAYNTLTSKVPRPNERARFLSIQSAVQHLASALGAFISSQMLVERADKTLEGMPRVTMSAILLSASLPFVMAYVERRLRVRDASL